MSNGSDHTGINNDEFYRTNASLDFLTHRMVNVSDRICFLYTRKMATGDFLTIMQTCESAPEMVNDRPPAGPGFNECEVFVIKKEVNRLLLNHDNYTPWYKTGDKKAHDRTQNVFYKLNTDLGTFTMTPKNDASHVLKIQSITLASCAALNKKIFRMVPVDNLEKHSLPSLIVYTFLPGFERPEPNSAAVVKRKALDEIQRSVKIPHISKPSTSGINGSQESFIEPKTEEVDYEWPSDQVEESSIDNQSSFNVQPRHISQPTFEMFSAGVLSSATVPSPMFSPSIIPIADLHCSSMDPAEIVQRNKLASLYRLVDLFRWSQGIYNHITVRVSSDPDEILINAFGQFYSEVTASSLIKVDLDGTVIDGGSTDFGVNQAGYVLHSAIHKGRPEIKCVVHLHHPSVVAVSAQKCGLLPISQESMIVGEVAYHEYQGILIDEAERELLVNDLGDRNVMILRNHGFVVCGESVEHALSLTYHLIIACETQVKTVPGGNTDNVHFPPQSAIKQVYTVASQGGGGVNRQNGHVNSTQWRRGELEWQAYMRQLDTHGYVTGHVYVNPSKVIN